MGALLALRAGGTGALPFDAMPLRSVCDGGSGVGSGGSGSSVLDRCSFRLSVSWVRLFTFQAIFFFF